MNTDDPKFTAHALGEVEDLTAAERAEIAALLASDADAAHEAETVRALAARLRHDLQTEESAALTETQRAAVLAAKVVPVDFGGEPQPVIVRRSPWRTLAPLALAASVAICAVLAWQAEFAPKVHPEPVSVEDKSPDTALPVANASVADGSKGDVVADKDVVAVAQTAQLAAPMDGTMTVDDEKSRARALESPALRAMPASTAAEGASVPLPPPPVEPAAFTYATSEQPPSPDTPRVLAQSAAPADPAKKSPMAGSGLAKATIVDKGDTALDQSSRQLQERAVRQPLALAMPAATPPSASMNAPSTALAPGTSYGNGASPKRPRADGDDAMQAGVPGSTATANKLALESRDFRYESGEYRNREMLRRPSPAPVDESSAASYDFLPDNAFMAVGQAPLSTFSIDVDTASYAIVRRFLNDQQLPPKGAVRIEELINYFSYDYPQPEGDAPFSSTMEVATCPWAPGHRLVRIGLKGREIAKDKRPPSNIVFLIDVSGSMQPANKLPLLKKSLGLMIDQLGDNDQVAMAVYAGNSGTVLEPTHSKAKMRDAISRLEAGGSTNGASGLQLAYELAENSFIKGGTNRVVLATDGDWNVGVTRPADLFEMITKKAKGGVFLTVLGYGMDNLKDSMLVKLADKGNGNYGYIDTLLEAKKMLADELTSTLVTIAKDVKIQVEFNPNQVAAYRLIGYEKRILAKEDFNDDTKDAGEIGAGHTVTALYEVVPAGGEVPKDFAKTDELKYQPPADKPAPETAVRRGKVADEVSKELLTLKLRYKAPDGDVSKLLEFPLTDTGAGWEKASQDLRFAASVAGYGMLLRDSPHKGTTTWNAVREWAVEGKGKDSTGYRAEFITLVEKARALSR